MEHANLAAAVCAVMRDVQYVHKGGRNNHHRYTYASDADLLRSLQPAMAKHGLCMFPSGIERNDQASICHLVVTYTLMHTSGESAIVMVPGSGSATRGSEDKGAYKAMTGAYKYALRQLFAVPTGDDPEKPPTPAELKAQRQAETDQQAAQRRQGHHSSWKNGGQAKFFAQIGSMDAEGIDYDAIKAWCMAHGKPSPSSMDQETRDKLVAWLADGNTERVQEWAKGQQ